MRQRILRASSAFGALALTAVLAAPTSIPSLRTTHAQRGLVAVEQPLAIPAGAVRFGPLSPSTRLSLRVVLSPRDPGSLSSFIARTSSPSSPDYRHYLARGQFAARFGPTSDALSAVRSMLRGDGLDVTGVSPSHLVLSVTGSGRDVARALHTSYSVWKLADGGFAYRSNGAVELPAAIAHDVAGVVGTSSFVTERSFAVRGRRLTRSHHLGSDAVGPRQPPTECSQAQQQVPPGTFTPEEEGDAYGLSSVWAHDDDGSGHTVALLEFAPYALSDILFYDACFGALPGGSTSDPLLHNIYVDGGTSRGSSGGSDEPTLDIEEIRAIAPQARLDVYEGPNNVVGPIDTLQRIATDDAAQIVSISWGICEQFSDHAAETPVFEQMAAQGQTVFAAAGDNGSSDCLLQSPAGGPPIVAATVDDPASQPLVTGVGGLTVTSVAPLEQTVWNDCTSSLPGCLGDAGGGGISEVYPHPSWQEAPGVPTGAERGATHRDSPDLSVMGDPNTGMLAFYQGTFQPYGGTSMGPPLLAAMTADDLESCGSATFGFLNPLLYAMGRNGGDFDDVTTGTNAIAASTYKAKEFDAGPGYDMASGLGSPDPSTFLDALCDADATANASPTTPNTPSTWLVVFHTGGDAYPDGATVTLTAPPGTRLPSTASDWTIETPHGTDPPTHVALRMGPGSTDDNIATLTVAQGAPAVGEITIQASEVVNPLTVGSASVGITDSVDSLAERAPLALSTASPESATLSVAGAHAPYTEPIGSSGLEVTATVGDGVGDVVAGQPVTITATGHAVARTTTTTTNGAGQVRFAIRADRVGTTTVTVASGGTPLGSLDVHFTNPWRQLAARTLAGSGAATGIASVVPTGGAGFVAVVRTAGDSIDLVRSAGARAVVSPLHAAGQLPAVGSNPTIARGGAWLYVAYRSTAGHLVVLADPLHAKGMPWRIDDLTSRGVVPSVTGVPAAIVAGAGARAVLSLAAVATSGDVLRVTARLEQVTQFTVSDLSRLSGWSVRAAGSVAQATIGGGVVVFARSAGGELVELARDAGEWIADDVASDALLVGLPSIATGSPVAIVGDGLLTVIAPSRGGLNQFVGTLGNWSASTLTSGDEGTSAPSDAKALPALPGAASVLVDGAVTEVVCGTSTGRLLELTSLGVSAPWAAFDLTQLAHLDGAVQGAAVLPGGPTALLVAVRGHLVVLHAVS